MSTSIENNHFPAPTAWMQFLLRAGFVLGLLLCASAVITLIAANWSHLDKTWRIGGVQVLIVALTAISVWLGKRNPMAWEHEYSPSVLLMGGAGAVVGGLFALLGQTYQTGADPWQLFALWAGVLLPWLWASRSLFLAVLWMVLLNVSVALWIGIHVGTDAFLWSYGVKSWWPMLLNAGLLLTAEQAGPYFSDRLRVLPRTALLLTAYATGMAVLATVGLETTFVLTLAIAAAISGTVLYWYLYRKDSFDLLMGSLGYALVFILTIAVLGHAGLYEFENLFLLIVLHSLTAIVIIRELSRRWRAKKYSAPDTIDDAPLSAIDSGHTAGNVEESHVAHPWFLRLFRFAIAVFIGGLLSFFLGAHFWSGSAYMGEFLMAIGFISSVILSRANKSLLLQDMAAVALVSGMVFGVVSHFSGDFDVHRLKLFIFALIGIVLYVASVSWPMRILSSLWTVGHIFAWLLVAHTRVFWFEGDFSSLPFAIELYAVMFTVLALVLAGVAHQHKRYYEFWAPAMWVSFFASFIAVSQLPSLLIVSDGGGWEIQWHISSILLMLLPALALCFSLKRSHAASRVSAIAVATVFVASVAWTGFPLLTLALAWGFLAFLWRNKAMRVLAGLAVLVALSLLYYSVELSLNQKALMLGVTGLWLLIIVVLLPKPAPLLSGSENATATVRGVRYRHYGLAVGLIICLGVANVDIWSKERLLREGQRVVLELAPVDPRSLMQGDYMALRYQISAVVSQGLYDKKLASEYKQGHLWLWLEADDDTVAWKVRGIQTSSSSENIFWLYEAAQGDEREASHWSLQKPDSIHQENLVRMRVRQGSLGWTPGTNAWFFAEGQAQLYENAKYGEFAVDTKGVALLRSLLDEQGHAIP
ncbi:GDYXXLXY domain-containing protein [Paenalcaligenes niemegkensis]|uniref:GDYXXLXY domain-containing protein n=1 Tax=Paenalcaligenes niemegkensis TaxID=2895469 RepID=UPI001EE7899A|nr:GDYXXLXY domain-containing protein [Paenalcaligenes niemegkensis]MCQ9617884.1 GDYXXLXY domain-containing protein [Paenalcaligenes niemegkensis]